MPYGIPGGTPIASAGFPWVGAAATGLGALGALFHKKPKYHPGTFNFNMDQNDPELQLLRRRALFDNSRALSGATDEVARAGLLGSSAGFGQLNEQRNENQRGLTNIDLDVTARRRLEALQLFRDQENFKQQMALGGQQQEYNMQNMAMGGLGDIGGYFGGDLEEYLRHRRDALYGTQGGQI